MDVDALMDLAITAGRDILGRAVTYAPASGDPVELVGIYSPASQFMVPELGGLDTGMPRLEFRTADLVEAGITPTSGTATAGSGDEVTFEVDGIERTYRVMRVAKGDVGSTLLQLGDVS